jgi:hypothetical protein
MTEKCEFCGYPLANYQDQVEHSSLAHPNVDPERTNSSVSPAQMDTTEYPGTGVERRTNGVGVLHNPPNVGNAERNYDRYMYRYERSETCQNRAENNTLLP